MNASELRQACHIAHDAWVSDGGPYDEVDAVIRTVLEAAMGELGKEFSGATRSDIMPVHGAEMLSRLAVARLLPSTDSEASE